MLAAERIDVGDGFADGKECLSDGVGNVDVPGLTGEFCEEGVGHMSANEVEARHLKDSAEGA